MRVNGWQRLLADHIQGSKSSGFEWGKNDCCTWVCDGLSLILGEDPMVEIRGTYSDPVGARRAIKRVGGKDLLSTVAVVSDRMRWQEIDPRKARSGDVGVIRSEIGASLALCWAWAWLGKSPNGITPVHLAEGLKAWRVD